MRRWTVVLTLAVALAPAPAAAQWRLDAWFGDAWNARLPLTFRQDGQPDIRITPNWSTRPWRPTWYYAGRVAKWSGRTGWGFEYMHHKLYLDNPPAPDVTRFRVTNGVNHLLVQRHWDVGAVDLTVGAGPTYVVPISTVRGKSYGQRDGIFGSRYEFGGGTLMAGVARRVKLFPYTRGSLTAKVTASYLDVPIADGDARTTNVALHLQYGLSLQSAP